MGKLAGDHPGGECWGAGGVQFMQTLAEDPLRRSPTMNQVALWSLFHLPQTPGAYEAGTPAE